MLRFRKFPAAKTSMDIGGVSKLSVENFLSHNAENFPKGTNLCCVTENFRQRKKLNKKGGYHDLPWKNFRLRVPKNFVGENFCVVIQKNSGSGKLYGLERGGIKIFCRKSFVSHCRKLSTFAEEPFVLSFRKSPVARNSMDKRGRYQVFPSKTFCVIMPKTFAREPFCVVFQKKSGSQKGYGLERGISRSSVERFFVSECRRFRRGKFLCCVAEKFR